MSYFVKELFRSFQGEGVRCGQAAVFCRFAGCNLWSGREEDRKAAACRLCDTDFVGTDGQGGGVYPDAAALTAAIVRICGEDRPEELPDDPVFNMMSRGQHGMIWNGLGLVAAPAVPYVVFTGGEPALQLSRELIAHLRAYRVELAVETNGTLPLPDDLDWVTVSPKAGADLRVETGQELKLLWPQAGLDPERFGGLAFEHFVMQPVDGGDAARNAENLRLTMEYCLAHPKWRLGVQMHKLIGIA
jgi:organic radical activating enzyme